MIGPLYADDLRLIIKQYTHKVSNKKYSTCIENSHLLNLIQQQMV
jgi:hypothetical protein